MTRLIRGQRKQEDAKSRRILQNLKLKLESLVIYTLKPLIKLRSKSLLSKISLKVASLLGL